MNTQVVDIWGVNHRVNLKLLGGISDAGLRSTLSPRGRDVARQLAHVHNVRVMWIEVAAKDLATGLQKFPTKESPSKQGLVRALTASADAVAAMLQRGVDAGGRLKGFPRGVIGALGYFLAHEAHHRGSILLTLKLTGHKVSTKTQYGIWEWNEI